MSVHVHASSHKQLAIVVLLVTTAMVLEVVAGALFGSMALIAEGWHMSTHASALGLALIAALVARGRPDEAKITAWAGLVSAVVLALIAAYVIIESVGRLLVPIPIFFDQAIAVAAIGVVVNVSCARILHHDHPDHNLRGAYLHVLSDGLLSVLSLLALLMGKYFGWVWLDAASAIVGALVIWRWSFSLMHDASRTALRRAPC
jgi:cation diffusion facilitator family transporter